MAFNNSGDRRQHANGSNQNQFGSPPGPANEESCFLYVKHISKSMSGDTLRGLFEQYGDVVDFHLDIRDDYPTYRARIQMANVDQCTAAIKSLNKYKDGKGCIIYVEFDKMSSRPRSSPSTHKLSFDRQQPSGRGRGSAMLQAANRSPLRHPISGQYVQSADSRPNRGKTHRYSDRGTHKGRGRSPRTPSNSSMHQGQQLRQDQSAVDVSTVEVEHCMLCNAVSTQRCSACKKAMYCSRECQMAHWEQRHKFECPTMKDPSQGRSTAAANVSRSRTNSIVSNYLESVRAANASDTDSICSSGSEEPRLPLNECLRMKLNDFESPSQFYVQLPDAQNVVGKLPRVWKCSLRGVVPSGTTNTWDEEKVISVCASNGLALGGPCKLVCHSCSGDVYQTSLSLRNDVDLASKLCEAGLAVSTEFPKYRVSASIHSMLEPGQPIQLIIEESSIKGVSEFYAQVVAPALKDTLAKFAEMSPKLTHYSQHIANKPPPGYKADKDDHVLAPFEGEWFRGMVTVANDSNAVVAFIDYGNISVFTHQQLVPMSKHFIDVPAIAVHCQLHGVLDLPADDQRKGAIEQIKALSKGDNKVKAVVRIVGEDCLTLDVLDTNGCSLSDSLVRAGLALASPADSLPGLSPLRSPLGMSDHAQTPSASAREITPNGHMSPLQANENVSSRQPANVDMPPLLPVRTDMSARFSADGSESSSLSTNSVELQPNSTNSNKALSRSTNSGMPPHLPANSGMPPLLPANSNKTSFLPANSGLPSPLSANSGMPSPLSANQNKPFVQTSAGSSPIVPQTVETLTSHSIKESHCNQTSNQLTPTPAGQLVSTPSAPQTPNKHKDGSIARQKTASRFKTASTSGRAVIYEKDIPASSLDLSGPTTVLLVNATDLHSVYISPADRQSMTEFLESMAKLSDQYLSQTTLLPPEGALVKGEILFALEPTNQEWDRVVVLSDQLNQATIQVRSVDYGNSYEVAIGNVRDMCTQGARLAKRATKVKLLGVQGSLNQEGVNLLLSLTNGLVTVQSSKVKGQLEYEMHSEQFGNINEKLKRHLVANDSLDSHGSSSDSSLPASSPNSAPSPYCHGDDQATQEARLEQQINALRVEKKQLQEEITLLKQKPLRREPSRKSEECEEFTL